MRRKTKKTNQRIKTVKLTLRVAKLRNQKPQKLPRKKKTTKQKVQRTHQKNKVVALL